MSIIIPRDAFSFKHQHDSKANSFSQKCLFPNQQDESIRQQNLPFLQCHWSGKTLFFQSERDQRGSDDEFEEEAHGSLSENGGSKMEDGLPSENGAAGMPATWTVKPARQRVNFWEKVNQWRMEDREWREGMHRKRLTLTARMTSQRSEHGGWMIEDGQGRKTIPTSYPRFSIFYPRPARPRSEDGGWERRRGKEITPKDPEIDEPVSNR